MMLRDRKITFSHRKTTYYETWKPAVSVLDSFSVESYLLELKSNCHKHIYLLYSSFGLDTGTHVDKLSYMPHVPNAVKLITLNIDDVLVLRVVLCHIHFLLFC